MSDVTYYNLHDFLDNINNYICDINLPHNEIILNESGENTNSLHTVLNKITKYICNIKINPEHNCMMISSPTNIENILDVFSNYLCNIELIYDCIDIDSPNNLHNIIDGITEYLCNINVEYDCTGLNTTNSLHNILNNINNYLCFINITDNCVSDKTIISLHELLQDIITYICEIPLDINCISAPNPGSLHQIIESISDYVCNIPLCENCIIDDSVISLHDGINKILEYLCYIDIPQNCIDIPQKADLHTILQYLSDYVCKITISDNCIPGLSNTVELYELLDRITEYLCKIPITCDFLNLEDEEMSLHSVLHVITTLYCYTNVPPVIHLCIDLHGINTYSDFTVPKQDFVSMAKEKYGDDVFADVDEDRLDVKAVCEIKSFLVPSLGPTYKFNKKYSDIRAFIEQYPHKDFWEHIDFGFRPDTGDYSFTRYTAQVFHYHSKYNPTFDEIRFMLGPIGAAACDIWHEPPGIPDWRNKWEMPDEPIMRLYSQRTRLSCRMHILISDRGYSLDFTSCANSQNISGSTLTNCVPKNNGYECICPDGSTVFISENEASTIDIAKSLVNYKCPKTPTSTTTTSTTSSPTTTNSGLNTIYKLNL